MSLIHNSRRYERGASGFRLNGFWLVGLAALVILVVQLAILGLRRGPDYQLNSAYIERLEDAGSAAYSLNSADKIVSRGASDVSTIDSVIFPYDQFILTQGPHGFSYGHSAIDITAGDGAEIRSPITGKIEAIFLDEIGNTTLVIENERFKITLLHGRYNGFIGQGVVQGQVVGTESNIGNTTDMLGRSCRGRNCGHHTHINVFDKSAGANLNPLNILK